MNDGFPGRSGSTGVVRADVAPLRFGAGALPAVPTSTLWQSLSSDAGCAVLVFDLLGRLEHESAPLAEPSSAEPEGTLARAVGAAMASEWVRHARDAAARGAPVAIETAIGGRALVVTLRPFESPAGTRVLGVIAPDVSLALARRAGITIVTGRTRDLGPLRSLTRRELEILGWIGEGLTSQQIAKRLSRSVKTVEWHRVSIGQKLGVKTRVELARLARDAGLHGHDDSPGMGPASR